MSQEGLAPEGLSYLPGDLVRHLAETPVDRGPANSHLTDLRNLVISGYYRAAMSLAPRVSHYEENVEFLADIFCSMLPFRYRLAEMIAHGVTLPERVREILLDLCVGRYNPVAFRFLAGSLYDKTDALIARHAFSPGYAEALIKNLVALARPRLHGYILPSTYEEMGHIRMPGAGPTSYVFSALFVENYRLARHLKAKHLEEDFGGFIVGFLEYEYHSAQEKMLAWMLKEGWITEEDVEDVQRAHASDADVSD